MRSKVQLFPIEKSKILLQYAKKKKKVKNQTKINYYKNN